MHNSNRAWACSAWIVTPVALVLGCLAAGCTGGPLVAHFDDPVLASQVNVPITATPATAPPAKTTPVAATPTPVAAATPSPEPAVAARPTDTWQSSRTAPPEPPAPRTSVRTATYTPPPIEPVTPIARRDRDEMFAPQATSMFLANPPVPSAQARLEKISASDALTGPKRFSAGAIVTSVRNQKGQLVVTLEAVGQNKVLLIPGEADFYALSFRPDVLVMHDRSNLVQDTIRIFNFSPSGVRERTCGHGPRTEGYRVANYSDFKLSGRQISVTELLSASTVDRWPVRRTYGLPLD
jgi:hypothetical protein